MKKLSPVTAFILILLFFGANIFPQSKFEGKINIKYTSGDTKQDMIYQVKDEKIRMDFNNEKNKDEEISMIMDPANKQTIMLMPAKKMFLEYPYSGLSEKTKEEMDKNLGKFKMTGETKEIKGYNCQKIVITDEKNNGTAEIWATKDLGSFMHWFDNKMGQSNNPQWLPEFMREGFFPMLGIQKNGSGEEEFSWEVTKIEKQSLSSDLFTVPADYQKMSFPGMK